MPQSRTPCLASTLVHGVPASRTLRRSPHEQSTRCPLPRGYCPCARNAVCFRPEQSAGGKRLRTSRYQLSLLVGALQIGSANNLEILGFDINVATDSVSYSYFLKNKGSTEIAIAAAVSLPELQASSDRSETGVLAGNNPENPVGLTITAAGAAVTSAADVHAYALGVDRLAEIKAAHLPLIPFGSETDKALAALAGSRRSSGGARRGFIARPGQPGAPVTADWSLDVVRNWRQVLPLGKTTPIVVKFVPVTARYDLAEVTSMTRRHEGRCLPEPQVLRALSPA